MTTALPLKETAISPARVRLISADLARVDASFDADGFVEAVVAALPRLELKERVAWVADKLAEYLPAEYERAVAWILAALPHHDDETFDGSDFGLYTYAPYSDFVARYGCTSEHLQPSLRALAELTKHFTAEDALRYFLNAFPEETMADVMSWSRDQDYHVRRLASEGTRPLLPWSQRVGLPVAEAIPVLDNLYTDTRRFVTQSVANHVNDISRIDPPLALETLDRWRQSGRQNQREMDFILRNALRTLIKQGHRGAFEFLGLSTTPEVEVTALELNRDDIRIGEELAFSVAIRARRRERLVVDYAIRYPRPTEGSYGEAVFKLKTVDLAAGQSIVLSKAQMMRSTASRRLGAGSGQLQIQVNGARMASAAFHLRASTDG